MEKLRRFSPWLLGIALVLVIGWIAYEGYSSWKGATDTVKAAIIAALVTVVTFAFTKYFEQKEIYRQRIVKEKTDSYLKIINILFDLLKPQAIKKNKNPSENKIASDLYEIKKGNNDMGFRFSY